jgi:midasin
MSRLILKPTKSAKLQGDLGTDKRLNMRKIIPYIASQCKKHKIWLRRVKPKKRQFQVGPLLTLSPPLTCHSPRSWWPLTTAAA